MSACTIAGDGPSGVACASYRSTVAVLRQVCGLLVPAGARHCGARPRRAAARARGRDAWLPRAVELLARRPRARAGARPSGSAAAEQSALMLREVPRVPADACETGDWSHVDVYLTKRPGYRALLLPGSALRGRGDGVGRSAASRSSSRAAAWRARRSTSTLAGSADPGVRSLIETHVAELVAAALWERDPIG